MMGLSILTINYSAFIFLQKNSSIAVCRSGPKIDSSFRKTENVSAGDFQTFPFFTAQPDVSANTELS
jgi:hypothetical protein